LRRFYFIAQIICGKTADNGAPRSVERAFVILSYKLIESYAAV
jgi:hypothetical protein